MSGAPDEPDRESDVLAILDGGEQQRAAGLAIEIHGRGVYRYIGAVLRNEADADDVFSQFCEDVWRGLPGFRRECPLRAWCYKLGRNAVSRFLRDPFRRRGERLDTSDAARLAAEITRSTPREVLDARVAAARAMLTPEESSLVVLRIDRGLSWAEVAVVMAEDGGEVSEQALRKRFERIKQRLRALLSS